MDITVDKETSIAILYTLYGMIYSYIGSLRYGFLTGLYTNIAMYVPLHNNMSGCVRVQSSG
jgi:hypothetical protein